MKIKNSTIEFCIINSYRMLTELSICTYAVFITAYLNDLSFAARASFDMMSILLCLRGIIFMFTILHNWLNEEDNTRVICVFAILLLVDIWLSTLYADWKNAV
jgi:hypothetical protein